MARPRGNCGLWKDTQVLNLSNSLPALARLGVSCRTHCSEGLFEAKVGVGEVEDDPSASGPPENDAFAGGWSIMTLPWMSFLFFAVVIMPCTSLFSCMSSCFEDSKASRRLSINCNVCSMSSMFKSWMTSSRDFRSPKTKTT